MRTKTLSVGLLLALLLSFFVATPTQAAGAPAAPTNVVASDNSCTDAVTVSWTPPASAPAGYRIHVYAIASNYWDEEGTEERYTVSLVEVTGKTSVTLDLGRSYDPYFFEVSSVTNFSAPFTGGSEGIRLAPSSSQSSPAETAFTHFWDVPAPGNLTVAVDTETSLASARWSRPSVDAKLCTFESYHFTLDDLSSSDDDNDYENFDGTISQADTSYEMELEPFHRYEFCIWASSQRERSYSEYISYADSPAACVSISTSTTTPGAPSNVSAFSSGSSITVSWDNPWSDGGTDITGYRVGRSGTDASGSGPWSTVVAADRRSQTFTNLRPNTPYTFTVQSINAVGSGEVSSVTQVANPYSPPSAPTAVSGSTNDAARTATISWAPPTSAGNPVISGYRVSRNGVDNAGSGPWSTTVGSSTRSFTFTNLAANGTYTLTVSAVNAGGESPTAATVVALRGAALTAATPTIAGTPAVGSSLTANAGTWGPSPVTLTYQWHAAGTAISGATASTYRPLAADVGKVITVAVTGAKSGYVSTTRVSSGTAAVIGGTLAAVTPTVSGTAKVGSVLSAAPGTWGPSPVILAYQWNANGAALSGATSSTYRPSAATSGKRITVTVTGSKSGYISANRTSTATSVVAAGALSTATPTITGTARVGSALSAVPGAWGPSPVTFSYQWKANGTALSGATSSTYRPTGATLGKRITVTVTGSKSGYTDASTSSATTSAVVAGTLTAATPTVSGTAKVGSTLTAKPGTWGPSPVALSYQWKANGVTVSGATAATYKPTTATVGTKITVTVTGKKTGYTTTTRTSAATAAVVK
ncbi:fibronectin type III domain-containing protein [Rathayibacter iranicus]|uniref:Fibronectin type-III domain-containing protein n=2 Tax=Rathayibacter iranicus TaxID=59737 RepID=A0AAD1AI70_9MICO|nr:fibronectin type III domain-containing protein [Rathayibacter iranicus]AZZ56831.1 hypothetical protein C7V51_13825 [Rathayibacter iranicus]MWV32016.1 hypothetical protein [Rathayibacter iranicus NCPPB 2253 = VKM Ac-1602]PPI42547.1 hypothetical protein C5E09_12675 [Rathayibacter iranicus]PPI58072.1 hypothetical protein C5E08_13585 [Rathayibacter iranicus]PPI68962.1 hypothetical protein C5E01_12630 [Rathayibacter iranicus]